MDDSVREELVQNFGPEMAEKLIEAQFVVRLFSAVILRAEAALYVVAFPLDTTQLRERSPLEELGACVDLWFKLCAGTEKEGHQKRNGNRCMICGNGTLDSV